MYMSEPDNDELGVLDPKEAFSLFLCLMYNCASVKDWILIAISEPGSDIVSANTNLNCEFVCLGLVSATLTSNPS